MDFGKNLASTASFSSLTTPAPSRPGDRHGLEFNDVRRLTRPTHGLGLDWLDIWLDIWLDVFHQLLCD
jgi:hypothetical protein